MSQILFTVESVFTVKGRGAVAVGISIAQYGSVQVGDEVELMRPDGSVLRARVGGVEYPPSIKWIGPPPANPRYGILLRGLTTDDVPGGTEVRAVEG